jgi:uncharacterized protein (TIGR02217 family)
VSNFIFPTLPGLTFNSVRSPNFNTGVQAALTSKESRIAYQQYLQMKWELTYELLQDWKSPSDLKALAGLFIAVGGQFDTFLYSDPTFNAVTGMQFAVADGTVGPFQITATYGNSGGPGGPELIQNFNGVPSIYSNGMLQVSGLVYSISGTGGVTFTSGHIPSSGSILTWSGSFYYRVRFDDDAMELSQFLANFWELKKLKLKQIKL